MNRLLLVLLLTTPLSARALELGFDVGYAVKNESLPAGSDDSGFSADVRLGVPFDLPLVKLTPEVGGGYTDLGGVTMVRGFAGGRLAVGEILRPSVFAHVGYGTYDYSDPAVAISEAALLGDAGVAFDFTLAPAVDLGVHGAYNAFLTGDFYPDAGQPDWFTFGLHVAIGL